MDFSKIGEDEVCRKLAKKEPNLSLIWKASNIAFWGIIPLIVVGLIVGMIGRGNIGHGSSGGSPSPDPGRWGLLLDFESFAYMAGEIFALAYVSIFYYLTAFRKDFGGIAIITAVCASLLFAIINTSWLTYNWYFFAAVILPIPILFYKHFRLKKLVLQKRD